MHRDPLSFLDKYSIEQKVSGSDETLLRDKLTGGYVLMKEVQVESNEQFKIVIDTLEGQRCLHHQHLLSLIDYEIRPEESRGTVLKKVITFFEYSSHNLEDQIEARVRENRPFDETELWSLICSPVLGLAYLQKENVGHGCISPIDIFLTPEGTIKIADPSIATSSPLDCIEGYYYSPQMLSAQPDIDVFKSDVFSLAMCAVHAGLLETCQDCYDYPNREFYCEVLQQKLQKMAEIYSHQIMEVIVMMLHQDHQQRPNFLELEEQLVDLLGPQQSILTDKSEQSLSRSKSIRTRESQLQLPTGIKPCQQQLPDEGSTVQQQHPDIQSEIDKCEDPNSMLDSQCSEEMDNCFTQINVISRPRQRSNYITQPSDSPKKNSQPPMMTHVQSEKILDLRLEMTHLHVDRPAASTTRTNRISQVNQPSIMDKPPFRLTESKIPMSITTSKYQQQQNTLNLMNLSNKTSLVVEDFKFKPTTVYTHLTTLPDTAKSAYQQFGGYTYKPSNQQLFTDPKLLQMMKSDLERIQAKQRNWQRNGSNPVR